MRNELTVARVWLVPDSAEIDPAGFKSEHCVRDRADQLKDIAFIGEADAIKHVGGDGQSLSELDAVTANDSSVREAKFGDDSHDDSSIGAVGAATPMAETVEVGDGHVAETGQEGAVDDSAAPSAPEGAES